MHEALVRHYYDDTDTVVVDLEDRHPPRPRPRALTEELTMHVYVEGEWHRRMPDLSATACDVQYNAQFAPTRREELVGDLCRTCFTGPELMRAARANTAKSVG